MWRGTGLSAAEFMRRLYASQRVSVMDGAAFGLSSEHCVRVCFATGRGDARRSCTRLRRFFEELSRRAAGSAAS